ncbi:mpv17-like protein [Glandiceps talaboti]
MATVTHSIQNTMHLIRRISKSHLLRNAIFVGGVYATSECLQQKSYGEKRDIGKVRRMAIWGFVFNGPGNYGWYKVLDRIVPGNTVKVALKKVLLEKVSVSPLWVSGFYVVLSLLEGKPDIFSEAKEKVIPTYLIGLTFWIPAQALNFLFVPHVYRVVYVGVAGFMWANILCYMKRYKTVNISTESACLTEKLQIAKHSTTDAKLCNAI